MDLLFSKYASPFIFLDQMIALNRLSDFVSEFLQIDNENKLWELYLACVANPYAEVASFDDFKLKCEIPAAETKIDLEATLKNSSDILTNFKPA